MATPTPSPPTDPMQWREKLTEEKKRRKNKGEKQQDEI